MYQISKMFSFEAAHHLNGLPAGHQCARQHGHSYRVELVFASHDLDERGFVVDYGDLAFFDDYLNRVFDHRDLNEVLAQPTAEHLARHLWKVVFESPFGEKLFAVRVSETQKTWAEYRP